ncbi:phosphoglycerate mutase-like protein [Lentithecium fluviatile CBS 122367]|uniref:3-phytase n=1 Tax=Lentithecium fluviatile CBS 122367 TaxID=1168545 RepID=A0A6G1ICE7_9PLEO|nr:phosphoglycerate mutase-like protein [Lentithecium fluviatile CBS 122367]
MKSQIVPVACLAALLALLTGCGAAPATSVDEAPNTGSTTSDLFPPSGTVVDSELFPPEAEVGEAGPTPTGAEPAAIQTAPVYPYNDKATSHFPLVNLQPHGSSAGSAFDISKYWGNLSPWYSVHSADYGLPDASPLAPEGCDITQMHLLYRHGARYPTSGQGPSSFATKLANATKNGLSVSGDLAFLGNWTYKLGAELLTPFGRSQNFLLGAAYRQLGSIGTSAASKFAVGAFNSTIARLQSQASGIEFNVTDIVNMLQLCAYETNALGYSAFCDLFSEEDFLNFEYLYDLSFYYNNGPGSPVSAAQGKGYLDKYIARFTGKYPAPQSALNETFDNTSTYFPLDQSIYADATHEVVVLDALMAFNLTALFDGPPLSVAGNRWQNSFVASKVVPFATHFTTQVLSCPAYSPSKQIRFILNDAVIPIDKSYPGCPADPSGLCSFEKVVSVLQKRSSENDFDYDCFANYTAEADVDYNGRAPR